ncbi:MAG: NAD(P)H-hydrate epimerase [Burkholderiales bacterium]|nr:NAD(P)H-hydrate epimerase [Burkholderiales bacterium]
MPSLSPLLTVPQLRSIEKRYTGASLMQKAGAAAFDFIKPLLKTPSSGSIVVLCGPGNNGGDGLVLARLLREQGFSPCVVAPATNTFPPDAAEALAEFLHHGGTLHTTLPNFSEPPALIVDAIFGIGLNRAPAAPFDALIRWINDTHSIRRVPARCSHVVSLDIPSGLNSDTGVAHTPTVCATATLSFIALKPGLLTLDGPDHCGELRLATLDIPSEDLAANADAHALHRRFIETHLPATLRRRFRNAHKGTFGCLGILGGASGMAGAPILAGRAATRMGTGKVRVGFLGDTPLFDPGCPELMLHPAQALLRMPHDAWAVGCGLGTSSPAPDILTAAFSFDAPLLLDADALTLLGHHPEWTARIAGRHAPTVLTPHPAEAARLLQCSTDDIQRDRPKAACEIAQRYRAHTVLKGCGSVVADPGTLPAQAHTLFTLSPRGRECPEGAGEGERGAKRGTPSQKNQSRSNSSWCINTTGNPALAFGGSGDVLAGMIGALLAQGVETSHALRYAVCLHGAAADVLVEEGKGPVGVLSEDIIQSALGLVRSAP